MCFIQVIKVSHRLCNSWELQCHPVLEFFVFIKVTFPLIFLSNRVLGSLRFCSRNPLMRRQDCTVCVSLRKWRPTEKCIFEIWKPGGQFPLCVFNQIPFSPIHNWYDSEHFGYLCSKQQVYSLSVVCFLHIFTGDHSNGPRSRPILGENTSCIILLITIVSFNVIFTNDPSVYLLPALVRPVLIWLISYNGSIVLSPVTMLQW